MNEDGWASLSRDATRSKNYTKASALAGNFVGYDWLIREAVVEWISQDVGDSRLDSPSDGYSGDIRWR
jgi:hypothetical protein